MNYVSEDELKQEIINIQKSNKIKKLKEDLTPENIKEIQYLESQGYVEKYSKTKFGEMILLMVKKRATSSKFVGYTYKEDFYSLAIQHILSYSINNFDPDYISPRTGKPSKAFSYITEIISRSFVAIINENAEINEELHNLVSLDSLYDDLVSNGTGEYSAFRDSDKKFAKEEYDGPEITITLDYNDGLLFGSKKTTIYDVVKENQGKRLKIIYPEAYSLDLVEYEKLKEFKFEYLNISKIRKERYQPSFPKKALKEKEDLICDWE